MTYQVYTFPNCEKCHKAVQTFKERGIGYEEISAGTSDGRLKLREFTKKYNDVLEKEVKDGVRWLKLPLIVSDGENLQIYQGEEGLEKVLSLK